MHAVGTAFALLSLAGPAAAAELFVNGNFEAGNSGFASGYSYIAPSANALATSGRYTIASNAAAVNAGFASFGDVTTGSGHYLVANGAATPGATVWSRAGIAVVKGSEYLFDGFIAGATAGSRTKLDVFYSFDNDTLNSLGNFVTLSHVGEWLGIEAHFIANGDFLTIAIVSRDAAPGVGFGIDDLRLIGEQPSSGPDPVPVPNTVPEPAVWGLMVAGFGLVGTAARRRRRSVAA